MYKKLINGLYYDDDHDVIKSNRKIVYIFYIFCIYYMKYLI